MSTTLSIDQLHGTDSPMTRILILPFFQLDNESSIKYIQYTMMMSYFILFISEKHSLVAVVFTCFQLCLPVFNCVFPV